MANNADGGRFTDQSAARSERPGIQLLDIQPADIAVAQQTIQQRFLRGERSHAYQLAVNFLSLFPAEKPAELEQEAVSADLTRFMSNVRRGQYFAEGYFHLIDEAHVLLPSDEADELRRFGPSREDLEAQLEHARRRDNLPFIGLVRELAPELATLPSLQFTDAEYRTQVAMIQAPYDNESVAHFALYGAALKTLDPERWAQFSTVQMTNDLVAKLNDCLAYYRGWGERKIDFFWTLARAMATLAA